MLADVKDVASGSNTKYYRGGVLGSSAFELAVRNCI